MWSALLIHYPGFNDFKVKKFSGNVKFIKSLCILTSQFALPLRPSNMLKLLTLLAVSSVKSVMRSQLKQENFLCSIKE